MRLAVTAGVLALLSSSLVSCTELRAGRSRSEAKTAATPDAVDDVVLDDWWSLQDSDTFESAEDANLDGGDYVPRELMDHDVYAPLRCNDAILSDDSCLATAASFRDLLEEQLTGTSTDPVVIPCGECVTVDVTDGSTLTLPHGLDVVGRLHFPPTANVVLNTTAVFVQGQLDMTEPVEGSAVTVTLFGVEEQFLHPHEACAGQYEDTCLGRKNLGTKPIVVAGGKLNIQARPAACPSWTRLVSQDSNRPTELQVDTDFALCAKAGDQLLVASASHSWDDDTVRTVSSVNATTGIITLGAEISRSLPGLNGPGESEFAVEVAILSRSVTFEAQDDNPQSQIGGHLIVYHTPDVPQLLSGVHFRNMGQGGILGRYPIHFHLSGNSPSTISGNVVTQSNQRCYVIHQTNGVTVANNVAYATKGHCYITENGLEENNVFAHNLGARTELLTHNNGQSDSNGGTASTFWIRNMRNEFYGNVAAGSQSIGWWFEFTTKYSSPSMLFTEPVSSFRDNVAHSIGKNGMTTYRQGYFPSTPAVFDNIRIYKCGGESGWKSHFTGVLTIKNSLFADNKISVRYGVKNEGIILQDTKIIALSNDMKERGGKTCPLRGSSGVYASYNVYPSASKQRAIVLKNVTMERFVCSSRTIRPYFDGRRPQAYKEGMGDPIQASVTITASDGLTEDEKPYFDCGSNEKYTFLEDFGGGLGPSSVGTNSGFVVRNEAHMKAFLPPGACEPLPYGGSLGDGTKCNAFCKNVCLRMFHITSGIPDATSLILSQGDVSYTYSLDTGYSKFRLVLPSGSYYGQFFDAAGNELIADAPSISTFKAPQCTAYADASSFTFGTRGPTSAPSAAPLSSSLSPTRAAPSSSSLSPTRSTPPLNLSQGKPASQKCNYSGRKYLAKNGVDGIVSSRRRFITHTCRRTHNAWWKVDLQAMKEINNVMIWNRIDCCQFRLSDFFVKFLNEDGELVKQMFHPGGLGLSKTLYPPDGNVNARYVQIELTSQEPLSVLEVKVMGW